MMFVPQAQPYEFGLDLNAADRIGSTEYVKTR